MKWFRIISILLLLLFILLFALPNIINSDERAAFDDERRLTEAQEKYSLANLGDSITIAPGPYYGSSSGFYTFWMGKEYRKLWELPVKMPVFNISKVKGGLSCTKIGGGDQTTSLTLMDSADCAYTLRSVDKDQSGPLSPFWRSSVLRPMLRDQAAGLMPWGIMTLAPMYDALDILGTSPQYYFIPYDPAMDSSCRKAIAGKVAILEIEPEKNTCERWPGQGMTTMKTEKMMRIHHEHSIPIDARAFAKCRLLDVLVGDWDRHFGNWAWNLVSTDSGKIIQPIPIDRDMVFFRIEGVLPEITQKINPKFQSFSPDIAYLKGYMHNSMEVDKRLLMKLDSTDWIEIAYSMQNKLTDRVLMEAMSRFPQEVPVKYSRQIFLSLKARRDELPDIAQNFYSLLHEVE